MNRPDPLLGPLGELEALGLRRPPDISVEQLFEKLVQSGVLPPEPAARYLRLYREARFGGREAALSEIRAVSEALALHVQSLGEEGQARIREIGAAFPKPAEKAVWLPKKTAKKTEAVPDSRLRYEKALKQGVKAAGRPARWVVAVGIALVLVWSLAVFYAGIRLAPRVTRAYDNLKAHLGLVRPEERRFGIEEQIALLADKAARNPNAIEIWWRLAFFSAANRKYESALMAYQHVLARDPGNAEARNNIAWILLTASNPVVRDPVWALSIAEQAYEISKAPHIADTLAEACFQNGDRARAIAIEEVIAARFEELKLPPDERSFYLEQLKKFRQAGVSD